MSNRAATSTPWVGSSARMTLTSPRRNGRVSETFCWFPPDSVCTGCSIDAVRMLRRRTRSSTVRRSRRRLRNPRRPSRRSTWIVAVGSDAQDGEERFGRPVAAQQHDSRAQRPERRARVELLAVAGRRARGPLRTGERPEELHLPVALRARDSDDLAARHLEVDRPEPVAPQSRDREQHLALRLTLVSRRKRKLERTPDHESDEALLRHRGGLERSLAHAVAENADPIGDAEDLGQPVADVDDPDAGAAPLVNERVESVDVLGPEGRRRLVEEQHLRLGEQRLDDLEELSLRERERPRGRGRRDVEVELGQPIGRPARPCVRTSVGGRTAPRGRGSRPPTGARRASTSDRRCRDRACGSRRERLAGARSRPPRRCPRRERGSRWLSRAVSISRTRSPRRGRGSRRHGSRR